MKKLIGLILLLTATGFTATNERVVTITQWIPPTANAAQPDAITGGDVTAPEQIRVWDFQAATSDEYVYLLARLDGYDGGGLSFFLMVTTEATTCDVVPSIAIRRMDTSEDYDGVDHAYAFNLPVTTGDCTMSGTARVPTYCQIDFADGSDMDSWADQEWALIAVIRDISDANDTCNSNDLELWDVVGIEQ